MNQAAYMEFIRRKVAVAPNYGFEVQPSEVNPALFEWQKLCVCWGVLGGRRAYFMKFGLGKTIQQLETLRLILARVGGRGLIVTYLGVRQEFQHDAVNVLGWPQPPRFIRSIDEADETGIYLTNYETIRDGRLDPRHFNAASLDEGDILRGFGGTKTFRECMRLFAGDGKSLNERVRSGGVPYRFVATATPSPNELLEIAAYAAFLGILEVSDIKSRFFKRDSTKADNLTLHPHKESEFWRWVSTWGLFLEKPSDLGAEHSDAGYDLPELDVRWHQVPTDYGTAGTERDGQGRLFPNASLGVVEASREKRNSLQSRIAKMLEIRAEQPYAHRVIWHDLESEREAIEAAVPTCRSVYGSQDLEDREQIVADFKEGRFAELAAKPVLLGSGTNLQKHCHHAIYLGIGWKFKDFIQSCHRLLRYLQTHRVRIDLIYTEAERDIRADLERKWTQHNETVAKMTEIIREHGLSQSAMIHALTRSLGVERVEVAGERYRLVNNDCIDETRRMESSSVDLILTSIPFGTQYSYSDCYEDFGHTDNNAHFFEQMGFLTPELLRVLKPGRLAAIHVKDRIVPAGMTGLGRQTVYPFSDKTREHFEKHGFAFAGRKTIVTDVVRENNQTYRLGWSEQCKDGTKMGFGLPEYLLLFFKPPTDTSDGYADDPVVKQKPLVVNDDGSHVPFGDGLRGGQKERRPIVPGTGYSRSRWQIDAHGFTRSSGNRLIGAADLGGLSHDAIFKLFRDYNLTHVYDFEHHVKLGETLEARGALPVTFMLLQPPSWSDEVWSDIARMLTLNTSQSVQGKEQHLCPMPLDIANRAIAQWSMPGELVLDPFAGIGTTPYCAILQGRRGYGIELKNDSYFLDACSYCKAAELKVGMPDLFAAIEREDGRAV